MRVTDIELTAGNETLLEVSLQAPEPTDRYLAKAIYGLDADELFPKFYAFGSTSGDPFFRLGMKTREIVMRLVLSPNWENGETYSQIRDNLYQAISRSRNGRIEVVFKSSATSVARTYAHIRKFEVPHFNKDAELQITLECEDPFLHGLTNVEYFPLDFDGTGYFSIPDQIGTAPHGYEIHFNVVNPVADISIFDDTPHDWRFTFSYAGGFLAGDTIILNSSWGERKLELNRGGDFFGLMNNVTIDSVWPILYPGGNEFYIPSVESGDVSVEYLTFTPRYWGV